MAGALEASGVPVLWIVGEQDRVVAVPRRDWLARREGFEPSTLRSEERWS